jgi:hypothetical protein
MRVAIGILDPVNAVAASAALAPRDRELSAAINIFGIDLTVGIVVEVIRAIAFDKREPHETFPEVSLRECVHRIRVVSSD